MNIFNIINRLNRNKNNNSKRKKLRRRAVSLAISAAMLTNSLALFGTSEFFDIPRLFNASEPISVSAATEYTPTTEKTVFSGSSFIFGSGSLTVDQFVDYCYWYQTDTAFASAHKSDVLDFAGAVALSEYYLGLGTQTNPFEGKLRFPTSEGYNVQVDRALFSYISDKAKITNMDGTVIPIIFSRSNNVAADESTPLLADHVVHIAGGGSENWKVNYSGAQTYSGVIGEIGADAVISLEFNNTSAAGVVSNDTGTLADAGLICGKIGANAELKLNYTGSYPSVTSAHGNAGGLVGTMADGAKLRLAAAPSSYAPTVTSNGGYAGGIVGDMSPTAIITNQTDTNTALNISVGAAQVKGTTGAGGLYGHYKYNSNATINLSAAGFNPSAQVSGGYCGALFGVLETSGGLTVTSNNVDPFNCSTMSSGGGHFGGVIGKLVTSSLSDTVTLQDLKINATANTSLSTFGGVIGCVESVENTASYVKVNNVEVSATNPEKATSFGGVIGETSTARGVFVDLGNFKLTADDFYGGGVVGKFHNGVLRLSGTTDMSAGKPANANNCGQLIGENDNVLVYALGTGSDSSPTAFSSGWRYQRCNGAQADDLGTWGEVVRISNIETDILEFSSSAHTVTLKAPVAAMGTTADLVKTALNMQLYNSSGYGCLLFTSAPSSSLSISADISLANTGVIGFMRDGGSNIGTFSGTFNGNSHKITLAAGEPYGVYTTDQTEGKGQIYRHNSVGLFSVLGGSNCSVSNLTVDGTITVRNRVDGMNIGCIAAKNAGNITLSDITVGEISGSTRTMTINYHEEDVVDGTESAGKNIGGLIGFVGTNGTINVLGTSAVNAEVKFTGKHTSYNSCGGAIGKITAGTFTVNIGTKNDSNNKLTIGMNADVSGVTEVGADSNSGGLIGRIEKSSGSYKDRVVNINNLDFSNCTVGNASSSKGGGFLGYSWLNTTANIKGMTLTSANTIDNRTASSGTNSAGGNTDVGGMCYVATGKWVVDSLAVSSMSMPSGGSSSFGMLINKAYTVDSSNNYTGGLYLDVLNSGYTITAANLSGVTTSSKYDEIAAYTAKSEADILKGGAGVISINMNSSRSDTNVSVVNSGTYQNKLTASNLTKPNSTSRYYYNLDKMSSSDDGQNLLLWSVKKYAASNINSEFTSTLTGNTISGTANMTGLSFYPLAKADGITIGTLELTLDYSGVYGAESTFVSPTVTDGYVRDPGVTGNSKNQHYLMQSGLFIDLSEGSNLTINGALTLSGTFLETDKYKGALISDTMQGNLTCTSGSIVLNGITPKTTGNEAYADGGYLLINNIKRNNEQADIPELTLYNVSSSGYTDGTPVARSLIGPAIGPGLVMEFSKIQLPANSDTIFSQATLLDSIKTNKDAQLRYNFTWDDDWGDANNDNNPDHNVTYGYELTGSVQYRGKEDHYASGSDPSNLKIYFIRTDAAPTASTTSASDFSSYLHYVREPFVAKDENNLYFCELRVNVGSDGLAVGCGTYNDPYQISTPEELKSVAEFLNDGAPDSLGKVCLPKTDPSNLNLNSGNRWCTDSDHADYYPTSSNSNTAKFKYGDIEWSIAQVQQYLASAYYVVTKDITLDSDFVGLGGTTANTAFRGIIIGEKDSNGAPKWTITNNSTVPFINVSNGSVIKDLKIVVGNDITQNQDYVYNNSKYFTFGYGPADTANQKFSYYGGIIGEIMGGDNIIDNSYVDFGSHTVTLSGGSGTSIPVGGYVGVVVYGGLIFKNMDASKTTISTTHLDVRYTGQNYNLADNSGAEAWAAIYVNPIVGRVINGYAVNETKDIEDPEHEGQYLSRGRFTVSEDGKYHDDDKTERFSTANGANADKLHTLQNGTKHYTIADINRSEEDKLDVGTVADANTTGEIDVPNSQAMFILSLITQSCAGTAADAANGDYTNSLSYGKIGDNICGMSHNADYTSVGAENITSDISDYKLTSDDTAENSAVPYIVKHYTVCDVRTQTLTETTIVSSVCSTVVSDTVTTVVTVVTTSVIPANTPIDFTGESDELDGENLFIFSRRDAKTRYLMGKKDGFTAKPRTSFLSTTDNINQATNFTFNRIQEPNIYSISFIDTSDNNKTKYLKIVAKSATQGNLEISDTAYSFTIDKDSNGDWIISGTTTFNNTSYTFYMTNTTKNNTYLFCSLSDSADVGNPMAFCYKSTEATTVSSTVTSVSSYVTSTVSTYTTTSIETYTVEVTTPNAPARCITRTGGYYNIELASGVDYVLPDSYRGLGCVGIYDSETTVANNKYSIKLNKFDGKGGTIDADIYMNKFKTDNYFNVLHAGASQSYSNDSQPYLGNRKDGVGTLNHGIGLFNSVIMKDSPASEIGNFTLTGSVNTEIFKDAYNDTAQEWVDVYVTSSAENALWLSAGGVCGFSRDGVGVKFSNIELNDLTVNGSNFVGGLLGFSGLDSPTLKITVQECTADDISLKMTSSSSVGTTEQTRNAMGAFIGKVQQGAVVVYGTEHKYTTTNGVTDVNDDLTDYSEVKIKAYGFADNNLNYYASTGGLVGYSGHGFKAYDMKVRSSSNAITVGKSDVGFSGGIIGIMQPYSSGNSDAKAEFINCIVENINVSGVAAGGYYGGKWDSTWVPYSIKLSNCKLVGTGSNTITGVTYAGGLVGNGYVYTRTDDDANIIISDCRVTDYTISASSGKYSGGFVGYCNARTVAITCYIHDSSVENCVIGQGSDYAGGAIGYIIEGKKVEEIIDGTKVNVIAPNKILGYNIKLDNVTSPSANKGAWIGFVATGDKTTEIQFTGMAIYGSGFTQNIGNWEAENDKNNTNASFVYADYSGMSYGTTSTEAAQPNDEDNESYFINSSTKTITRNIVTISGNQKITRTLTYNYTEEPETSSTTEADGWSIDETNGTITRISGGTEYVYTIAVSGLNRGDTVDMPKYPFVNINPQSKLGDEEVLSSDGAVLYDGSNTHKSDYSYDDNGTTKYYPSADTMAAKIYYDYSQTSSSAENYSRRYTTFDNAVIVAGSGKHIDDYMKRTKDDYGDRISTFQTERQIENMQANVSDFAVIVIANEDTNETTDLINRYIQLVTNTPSTKNYAASDTYYNVDIKTCRYVYEDGKGSFEIDEDQESGTTSIYIGETGNERKFMVNRQYADSKFNDTFTLIDVQFKDPFNTNEIAYHLYVPVYTVKEMAIQFKTVAKTGAYSASNVSNAYADLIDDQATGSNFRHVDSLDTWMTQYIRYEYEADDIQALINQGKVRWNYKKKIDFETCRNAPDEFRLPGEHGNDTYMVLVDPNGDSDKAYYANVSEMATYTIPYSDTTKNCWRIDFNEFVSDDNSDFEFPSFYDLVKNRLSVAANQANGQYMELTSITQQQIENGEYDICIGSKYYEFRPKNDGNVNITLTGNDPVYEDYYLSIKVPRPKAYAAGDGYSAYAGYTNEMFHYYVKPTEERFYTTAATDNETGFDKTINSAGLAQTFDCEILIADLFKQTLTQGDNNEIRYKVSPDNELITAAKEGRTLIVDLSTVIEMNNSSAITYMTSNEFCHSFYITLVRKNNGAEENDIQALSDDSIIAKYSADTAISANNAGSDCADIELEDNYINIQTFSGEAANTIFTNFRNNGSVTIYGHIEMEFDDVQYTDEFPKSSNAADHDGVNVRAASNLAYDADSLAHSSMTKKYEDSNGNPADNKYYYIEDVKTATLRYVAKSNDIDKYDEIGLNSSNSSTLGVNGRSVDDPKRTYVPDGTGYMPVNTEAYYFVQEIAGVENATDLKLDFELYKKTDGRYPNTILPDLKPYLYGNMTFTINGQATQAQITNSVNGKLTAMIDLTNYDFSTGIIPITITFNAKSGSNFHEYANYKAKLTAELYKEGEDNTKVSLGADSIAYDTLIYTNAKVNPEYMRAPESA